MSRTDRSPGGPDRDRAACSCVAEPSGSRLAVDATECPHRGRLGRAPACRETVTAVLDDPVGGIAVRADGRERVYCARAPDLFGAAAAFAAAVEPIDDRLGTLARRHPLAAAREAVGRTDEAARIARRTGFDDFTDVDWRTLQPRLGLSWTEWRARPGPRRGRLVGVRELGTDASARRYALPEGETGRYVLEAPSRALDAEETRSLARAHGHLASSAHPATTPREAVSATAADGESLAPLTRILEKHVAEGGLLADFFADQALSDVFVPAPASRNPVWVRVDGERLRTNVYLTPAGREALASTFRAESGRGFSRATPTLDAATTIGGRRVRSAGVRAPVSEGTAYAFRAHDRRPWRLSHLVENGTLPPPAAALLSLAVERGAATLVAGPRGSGKTTLLGALLWELPKSVRTVVIEDTPELPVEALQTAGRDVQDLRTDEDGPLAPAEGLRSALRLGDGAVVVGEVRGSEAAVLYEAMRVGANSEAVLGTIHGDGTADVVERVVSDLGVPASSFAATDLVVTLETGGDRQQPQRRVGTIEEVAGSDPVGFDPLFERTGDGLVGTGRIDRGNSRLVTTLTDPDDTYETTLAALRRRAERFVDPEDSTGR